MSSPALHSRVRGFTLVESIVAITIIGILSAMVSVFLRGPIDAYVDTARRGRLTDAADGAIRRLSREFQAALPNSLRTPTDNSTACLEFLPVLGGGRYRIELSDTGTGDILDFTATSGTTDVLGHVRMNALPAGTKHMVIYNLGIPGADAYNGDTRAELSASSASSVTWSRATSFPFQSPGNRFQVIPNNAVVYVCSGSTIHRTTRAITAAPLASCPTPTASDPVLVSNVDCASTSFQYDPAVNQRFGVVSVSVALTEAGESVRVFNQVNVSNAP